MSAAYGLSRGVVRGSASRAAMIQGVSLNQVCCQLMDADDVRSARERLREGGVPGTEWQDDGRFFRVQIADLDGSRVELFAY